MKSSCISAWNLCFDLPTVPFVCKLLCNPAPPFMQYINAINAISVVFCCPFTEVFVASLPSFASMWAHVLGFPTKAFGMAGSFQNRATTPKKTWASFFAVVNIPEMFWITFHPWIIAAVPRCLPDNQYLSYLIFTRSLLKSLYSSKLLPSFRPEVSTVRRLGAERSGRLQPAVSCNLQRRHRPEAGSINRNWPAATSQQQWHQATSWGNNPHYK